MKKYNKPEIEALALEIVDVIATSSEDATGIAVASLFGEGSISEDNIEKTGEQLKVFTSNFTW